MYETRLLDSTRLRRIIQVVIDGVAHTVEYFGIGTGYEEIRVDGQRAVRTRSWLWYVPRFDFEIAGKPAWVEVRVSLAFKIRMLALCIGEHVVYSEGDCSELGRVNGN